MINTIFSTHYQGSLVQARVGNENHHMPMGKSINKEAFIFPHLTSVMSPAEIRDKVKLVTRLINNNMKNIAKDIEIEKKVTTYFARHSFATIFKNSAAPVAMISQALGYSSMATTQNYLASFETDQLKEATSALTAFK